MNKNLSALDIYFNRVFKSLMILIPTITLFAGLTISLIKFLGYYPEVSFLKLTLFDLSTIIYLIIGLIFVKTCNDKHGFLKKNVLRNGKIFLIILEFVQWNFLSFMVPSRDYWAYATFFILVTVFFMDNIFTTIVVGEIYVSIIINWIFRPDYLLPAKDEYLVPNLILRCVLLLLYGVILCLITYSLKTKLVDELEKIASIDTLTRLPNRRSLYSNFYNNSKDNKNLFILMLDIDNFKKVNDTYGHDCGDEVLKQISNIVTNCLHDNGIAYRYGGEEFLCLIPQVDEEAERTSELIRSSVESFVLKYNNFELSVTVTGGLQKYDRSSSLDDVIKDADEKLYIGKNSGKNKIVL